jgi:hypothetical protein
LDKIGIYGVFEFIGFHFCKRFLEKGLRVEGVHFHTEPHLFLEEKRLEIGRNANFKEKDIPDIEVVIENDNDSKTIIIPIYDWLMMYSGSKSLDKWFPKIVEFINDLNDSKTQIVYLLPIQLLTDKCEMDGIEDVRNLLSQTKKMNHRAQFFYLPTIFGPWQPPTFLFQRVMLNQFNETDEEFTLKEWTLDAIYVDDLLNPVIERIEAGDTGSFLLDSGIPKSWDLCAELLNVDESIKGKAKDVKVNGNDGLKKLILQDVTPFEKSLHIQREHSSYLSDLPSET